MGKTTGPGHLLSITDKTDYSSLGAVMQTISMILSNLHPYFTPVYPGARKDVLAALDAAHSSLNLLHDRIGTHCSPSLQWTTLTCKQWIPEVCTWIAHGSKPRSKQSRCTFILWLSVPNDPPQPSQTRPFSNSSSPSRRWKALFEASNRLLHLLVYIIAYPSLDSTAVNPFQLYGKVC